MTRRALLLVPVAQAFLPVSAFLPVLLRPLRADSADDAWELVASAARALVEATALPPPSRGNASAFLSFFDPKMPGYETLRTNVTALIEQSDLESTLDPVSNDGDDRTRTLEVDWELRMMDPGTSVVSARRQERIKCRVEKQGRKWRIVSLEPLSFFAPPHA
ncbi:conserved exported hypothetical protein [Candidatus Sulfopaludibacter sp. SbA4]|nr:conserved exported hypothetical protein [Candidatus Sulfopaludibacter sp. SbA4]